MKIGYASTLGSLLVLLTLMTGCSGGQPGAYERGGIDAEDLLDSIIDQTTMVLSDVFNLESANEALPHLIRLNGDFDRLIDISHELSPEGRQALAGEAARAMPGLKANSRRINGQKGIRDVLGEEINRMVFKMAELL